MRAAFEHDSSVRELNGRETKDFLDSVQSYTIFVGIDISGDNGPASRRVTGRSY